MRRSMLMRTGAALAALSLLAVACGDDDGGNGAVDTGEPDLGLDVAELSTTVDNPYVAFSSVTKAIFEGEELDPDEGELVELRVESIVTGKTATVAGVEVLVVDVADYEDGELVEQTEDYYVQHSSGDVYYMGEAVDEYEDGEVVGHGGEWLAGEGDNLPGIFMPASPAVGDVFEQERAPGIAEDSSEVVATGLTVTVPAGTFEDCIETEDLDPIDDVTESKFYCPDVGLVQEVFPEGGSLDLIELETA